MPSITAGSLGFFVTAPGALSPPSPLLADNINPETRDFASLEIGSDVVDAQVIIAVGTIRNSGPSVVNVGIDLTSDKMDEQFKRRTESDVQIALRTLISNGDIRLIGVTFDFDEPENQFAQARVQYVNLRAADLTTRSTPLPIRKGAV